MRTLSTILGLGMLLVSVPVVQAGVIATYDFENLIVGTLTGQDGWVLDGGFNMAVFQDALTGNGTKVAGGPFDQAVGSNFAYRPSNGDFSVPTISRSDTAVVLEVDVRVNMQTSDQSLFYLDGYNGAAWSGSPQIGVQSFDFLVRKAQSGANTVVNYPARIQQNDWVRLRLEMDLTALAGDGAGDLYYQDLTLGDTGFTPVAELQGVALGLNAAGVDPSAWTRLHMRTGFVGTSVMDNLTVGVPEPATLGLLALGGLGALLRRKRK